MAKLQLLFVAFVLANKSWISLRCVAPFWFYKPQRGDEIQKHLTKGQCVLAMRFWSIWPKVNASWFLWYVSIHHGYWGRW